MLRPRPLTVPVSVPAPLSAQAPPASSRSAVRLLAVLVVAAVLLRLGLLGWMLHRYGEAFAGDPAAHLAGPGPFVDLFGFEAAGVGWALACSGEGFASPFGSATGPTGWVSPGMAGLYAASFSLFGCFTPAARLALFVVALVLSAGMVLLAAAAARRLTGRATAGLAAGAAAAVSPPDLALYLSPSQLDWNLYPFLFLLLAALALRHLDRAAAGAAGARGAAAFGLATGAAVLASPALALPALVLFALADPPRSRPALARWAACGLAVALLVAPWILVQRARLGGWTFVKSNFGFELYLGNRPEAAGVLSQAVFRAEHPSQNAAVLREYRRRGELPFVRQRFAAFREDFATPRFLAATGRRVLHFFLWYPEQAYDQSPARVAAKRVVTPLPVLLLAAFVVLRLRAPARGPGGGPAGFSAWHDRRSGHRVRRDLLFVLPVLAYSLPYLVAAVLPRYALPLWGPVLVPAGVVAERLARRVGR